MRSTNVLNLIKFKKLMQFVMLMYVTIGSAVPLKDVQIPM